MNHPRHRGRLSILWLVAAIGVLVVNYATDSGTDGLVATLLAIAISGLCLFLIVKHYRNVISPDVVVLGMIGAGSLLGTFYLVAFEKLASLYPLPVLSSDVPGYISQALSLTLLGTIAFSIGYYVFHHAGWNSLPETIAIGWREKMWLPWIVSIVVFSVVGTWATMTFISINQGLVAIISVWNDRDSVVMGPRLLIYAMPFASVLWLAGTRSINRLVLVHLMVSFAFLTITGSRNEGIRLIVAAIVIIWGRHGVRHIVDRYKILLIIGGIALFCVYVVVIGNMRSLVEKYSLSSPFFWEDLGDSVMSEESLETLLDARYLPSVKVFSQVVAIFPRVEPFLGGKSFLAALDSWVPAFIYDDFPSFRIGKLMYQIVWGSDWDSAAFTTFMGELYLNWGSIGVPFGMACLGLICRIAYYVFKKSPDDPWIRTGYGLFVGSFLPFFLTVEAVSSSFYMVMFFYLWLLSYTISRIVFVMQPKISLGYSFQSTDNLARRQHLP